jgi:hypothetical protein
MIFQVASTETRGQVNTIMGDTFSICDSSPYFSARLVGDSIKVEI